MRVAVPVHLCCLLAGAGIFSTAASLSAQIPQYSAIDLGPVSSDNGYPYALNNSGQVTGYFNHAPTNLNRAFLYSDGVMTDIGFGDENSVGTGINASGEVTGYFNVSGVAHAFLYSKGKTIDLGTLAGVNTLPQAINDLGQIAGLAYGSNFRHAFLYSNGTMTEIGTLGGTASGAWAINQSGMVVGGAGTATHVSHAFSYLNGTMTDLGSLGGEAEATAVNDHGDISGYSSTSIGGPWHGFLYTDQKMTDLGMFGGDQVIPYAINNSKQIVGTWRPPGGFERSVLFSGGRMYDLRSLITGHSPVSLGVLLFCHRLNDRGQIVVHGFFPEAGLEAVLLTPKLHIASISKSPIDGHVRLTGFGLTAQDYTVEAAPIPSGPFAKIGMLRTGDDGTFEFEDLPGAGARFYRVIYP